MSETHEGVWVTLNYDDTGLAVFGSEVEALRHANHYGGMQVLFMRYGEDIYDARRRDAADTRGEK